MWKSQAVPLLPVGQVTKPDKSPLVIYLGFALQLTVELLFLQDQYTEGICHALTLFLAFCRHEVGSRQIDAMGCSVDCDSAGADLGWYGGYRLEFAINFADCSDVAIPTVGAECIAIQH